MIPVLELAGQRIHTQISVCQRQNSRLSVNCGPGKVPKIAVWLRASGSSDQGVNTATLLGKNHGTDLTLFLLMQMICPNFIPRCKAHEQCVDPQIELLMNVVITPLHSSPALLETSIMHSPKRPGIQFSIRNPVSTQNN